MVGAALSRRGDNYWGQLGDGTTTSTTTPPTSDVLTDVQAIAVADTFTCALRTDGGIRCWGDYPGATGPRTDERWKPSTTDLLAGVQAIAASSGTSGLGFMCALMVTGAVRCWGYGDPIPSDEFGLLPSEVLDVLTNVSAVAAGLNYVCALMTTGGVRCWGANEQGQLGDGTLVDRSAPPDSDVLTGVQAITTGDDHTCALMTTGAVRCWGNRSSGELGDGVKFVIPIPVPVVGTCQ